MRYKGIHEVLRLVMEHADGDKCKTVISKTVISVYFARSNDGIFWGKKLKLSLSACQKTLLSYVNLTYSHLKGQGIFSLDKQNSPITSHARLA